VIRNQRLLRFEGADAFACSRGASLLKERRHADAMVTAEAASKPALEICTNDVQCGHGATTGALDGELKFYLNARGIPAKEAETLLVQAFIGEAIDGIEHAGLREALTDATVN